jgi:hypothetical protein
MPTMGQVCTTVSVGNTVTAGSPGVTVPGRGTRGRRIGDRPGLTAQPKRVRRGA